MKKLVQPFFFVLPLLFVVLAACTVIEEPHSGAGIGSGAGTDVYVDELEVFIMESFPVQVSVMVRGSLADGCVALHGLEPVRTDTGWMIEIESSRDTEMACTEALVPFEENVSLDVYGLPAGTYTVSAGDKVTSFTLDMDNSPQEATAPEPMITLQRTPCFGFCPVYVVTLYSDGTAVFDGQDFVEQTGLHTEIIGVEGVNGVVDSFLAAGYLDWEDAYANREMTDMPSAITSLTVDGRTKRIDHYHGDSSAPDALSALEELVDEAANTAQWIGDPQAQLANPAAANCLEQGGRSEIRSDAEGNQYGVCIFEDGGECEEWAYFRGECEPSTDVSWETAVELIRGGFVDSAYQLHDLSVGLELKDGRSLDTVQPGLDDLFAVIDECGAACNDIAVMTE